MSWGETLGTGRSETTFPVSRSETEDVSICVDSEPKFKVSTGQIKIK
jgi:hypothetical protein